MKEFQTALLREKFIIEDLIEEKPVIAMSNRMEIVPLTMPAPSKNIVVRAHNMHSCLRLCGLILRRIDEDHLAFSQLQWDRLWDDVVNDYEYSFNPDRWVSVYNNGQVIFGHGKRHPLLDVIEKCHAKQKSSYELAIQMAEDAFHQTGKNVSIAYDGNVALVIHASENKARCSIILRSVDRTTTFTFTAAGTDDRPFLYSSGLFVAAAFLEGIQLSFMVGMNDEKIRVGLIERHSKQEKQTRAAHKRLRSLNNRILSFEDKAEVFYRPEKPDFFRMMAEANERAQKLFKEKED